jgi:hypothetical protein
MSTPDDGLDDRFPIKDCEIKELHKAHGAKKER